MKEVMVKVLLYLHIEDDDEIEYTTENVVDKFPETFKDLDCNVLSVEKREF